MKAQKYTQSEAHFRSYFELGLIGMAMTSPTKGILEANDEFCRILGYERDELLKKTWPELTHPDDLAADVAEFNRVMAGEIDGYTLDKRFIRKDGSPIHCIMAAKCVRRADRSVDYFVGLVLDTSARKRAEEDLRRSEAFLAEGQRISHTGTWTVKFPSGEVSWSEEMFRIYGLNPATTKLSQSIAFELIHPEDRARVQDAFQGAVREKTDYDVEHRAIVPDGTLKHLHALGHAVLNGSGDITEYIGTVVDITERKQTEEALRTAHERLELVVESITDTFFVFSRDWRFIYLNKHAAEQVKRLGKDPGRLIGKVLWDEFPIVPNEEAVRRVMSERVPISDELYYPPLGEWVENNMYPSPDGGLVTFQRYVTKRKHAQEELERMRAELAHVTRVAIMGELAASIAHEINQPLGAIANNANACMRWFASAPEEAREALRDISRDANRAGAMIARVRLLIKRSAPERTLLHLNDVLADVFALAQRELVQRRIAVQSNLADQLPPVFGDRVELQQVFLNLVMNAIEAMEGLDSDRSLMVVSAQSHELDASPAVLISVQDRGVGFRPENEERLFEPFFTTKANGLGMGLRISRSIVEAHGGHLWAELNVGAPGATFFCALPAALD